MTYSHIKLPSIRQQVAPNQGITYTAAGEVLMQDGFRAEAGAEFLAAIAPVSSAPSFQWRYAIRDHLGNTRVLFTDKNGDGLIRQSADENLNEVLAFYKYAPFGLELSGSHQNGGQSSNRYRYNGKELEAATGFYEYGARWYDAAVGRFLGVDPLAVERSWVSPYNYVQNNPILRIDPTGALDNPVYGSDGTYRGNTTEGFTGEVIVYDGVQDFTKMTSGQLLNIEGIYTVDVGEPTRLSKTSLSAEAASNILTHVTMKLKGINFNKLEGGIINVVDTPIDDDGFMGQSNGDSFGNWKNIPLSAEAGTMTNPDGSINVTTRLLGGKSQMGSVEYIQSVLGIHEYKGHGLMNIPEAFPAHEEAYKLQFRHKETFNKLTPYQQQNIKTDGGIK